MIRTALNDFLNLLPMTTLPTVNIKGKKYVTVNERIRFFREHHAGFALLTEVIRADETDALIKASIVNEKGVTVATGIAYERSDDKGSFVNATSHVENAETSAWGRALGNFGIGIDESVATADEVVNAMNRTPRTEVKKREDVDKCSSGDIVRITKLCKETETDQKKLYEHYGVQNEVPTREQSQNMIASLEAKLSKQLDTVSSNS